MSSDTWSTLMVTNVPHETTREQLEDTFSEFGPIRRSNVVKGKSGRKSTIAYVTFVVKEDCHTASAADTIKIGDSQVKTKLAPDKKEKKSTSNEGVDAEEEGESKQADDKDAYAAKKKARLIIRNLSFKASEKTLKEHFVKYGEVTEVNILKKANGMMVGCAFVQFDKINSAAKAIKEANAKKFIGRPIAVDWAVPKDKFKEEKKEEGEEKRKEDSNEEDIDDEKEEDNEEEDNKNEETDSENEEMENQDASDDDNDNKDENDSEVEKTKPYVPHNLNHGHDVDEGKTVFIRNLSYDSCEEDLKDMMEENFGFVVFAKMVMDKVMGHPRGTGFVKFRTKAFAEKCLELGESDEGIYLDNRRLTIVPAMKKNEVDERCQEKKKKEEKDSRNLYLAREGLIREGSLAAGGVSGSDMEKRLQVERWKKNILKNLHMFVSPTRLCVRNIPLHFNDAKLKTAFSKYVSPGAKINESKIIRDMKKLDPKTSIGLSKEYGFISFSKHEDALTALRNLNNNPDAFTKDKRPIVEFSIENKTAVNLRMKRMEKSREKNPNYKAKGAEESQEEKKHIKEDRKEEPEIKAQFTGAIADPKIKGLPTHSGPKIRHKKEKEQGVGKVSRRDLRKQELERKNPKKRKHTAEETTIYKAKLEEPVAKKSKKEKRNKTKKVSKTQRKEMVEEKSFNAMVNSYKSKLSSAPSVAKKWFD